MAIEEYIDDVIFFGMGDGMIDAREAADLFMPWWLNNSSSDLPGEFKWEVSSRLDYPSFRINQLCLSDTSNVIHMVGNDHLFFCSDVDWWEAFIDQSMLNRVIFGLGSSEISVSSTPILLRALGLALGDFCRPLVMDSTIQIAFNRCCDRIRAELSRRVNDSPIGHLQMWPTRGFRSYYDGSVHVIAEERVVLFGRLSNGEIYSDVYTKPRAWLIDHGFSIIGVVKPDNGLYETCDVQSMRMAQALRLRISKCHDWTFCN